MREILYRGQRLHDNKWIYGNLITDKYGEHHIIEPKEIEEDGHHLRIDSDYPVFFHQETIGQYTGLKDKNGVKIFEGDIIKYRGMDFEVEWQGSNGRFLGMEKEKNRPDGQNHICYISDELKKTAEVIGNIHEKDKLKGLGVKNERINSK